MAAITIKNEENKMKKYNLIQLQADDGKYLTDGKRFVKSIQIGEGQSEDDWEEITEAEFKRAIARMTPREFILKLMEKGITKAQIEALNANPQVWAELNFATTIMRTNPLLDELCSQFGLTPADVDEMFGL